MRYAVMFGGRFHLAPTQSRPLAGIEFMKAATDPNNAGQLVSLVAVDTLVDHWVDGVPVSDAKKKVKRTKRAKKKA